MLARSDTHAGDRSMMGCLYHVVCGGVRRHPLPSSLMHASSGTQMRARTPSVVRLRYNCEYARGALAC